MIASPAHSKSFQTIAERRKAIIGYFFVFLILIISSRASGIANADYFLVICTSLAIYQFLILPLRVDKIFLMLTAGYVLLTFCYFIKFGEINTSSVIRFYVKVLLGYLVAKITGTSFFKDMEDIVYKLSIISLFFFSIQIILPDLIHAINSFTQQAFPFLQNTAGSPYSSWIIFCFNSSAADRNSGFMWEPGGFAAILTLTIIFALTHSKFKINKRIIIMIIALITTFSTTGLLALGIISLYYTLNFNKKYLFLFIPLLVVAGIYVSQLDYVSKKIKNEFKDRNSVIENIENFENQDYVSLGRFGSMVMDLEDFKQNYLIGVGMEENQRTQSNITRLQRTNGLTFYLVMFGGLGFIYLLYNLTKSFQKYTRLNNVKGVIFFTLLILVLSFSNPVLNTPLFLLFQVYYMAEDFKMKPAIAKKNSTIAVVKIPGKE